jgi:hypothetical protein
LEARGFQDFATIAKEFAGRVVGPPILGGARTRQFRSPESRF